MIARRKAIKPLFLLLLVCFTAEGYAQQYRLGRLDIKGNRRTSELLIRRMIPLEEGDLFDTSRWELGLEQLSRSGLFEPITQQDADMKFDDVNGVVNVVLNLRERDRQRIDVNAGGGTTGGTSLGLDYSNINLTGIGDRIDGRVRLGTRERSVLGRYSATLLTAVPFKLDFAGFYNRFDLVEAAAERTPLFSERSAGATFGISAPVSLSRHDITPTTRAGLFYSFTSTNLADSVSSSFPTRLQQEIKTASITVFLARNTVDREFDPFEGEHLTITFETSGRVIGGGFNAVHPGIDYSRFWPVGTRAALTEREPSVFAIRARASHVSAFGRPFEAAVLASVRGVPVFKRFFLGGESEVRGYDSYSIAPLAQIDRLVIITGSEPMLISSDLRPIGGDTKLILNGEYRIPIVSRVSAAVFVDLGASFNARRVSIQTFETEVVLQGTPARVRTVLSPAEGDAALPAYRISIGSELRFLVPVLNIPLRFIFAVNPNAQTTLPESVTVPRERRLAFRIGFSRTL